MLKRDEIADPNSCLNRAKDDEPIFVLRAHDMTAGSVVRTWAHARSSLIACGLKPVSDQAMIQEALELADKMDAWKAAEQAGAQGGAQ